MLVSNSLRQEVYWHWHQSLRSGGTVAHITCVRIRYPSYSLALVDRGSRQHFEEEHKEQFTPIQCLFSYSAAAALGVVDAT